METKWLAIAFACVFGLPAVAAIVASAVERHGQQQVQIECAKHGIAPKDCK